ncbi:MAG: hypothetical protein LBF22_01735 [Deltaproteobacteria bacterium]|jgi:hypothetical protein|nr:hypothetical protein [Deltaproteobacteria bacterium]
MLTKTNIQKYILPYRLSFSFFILAFLVSVVLLGSDATFSGNRLIYTHDFYNHLKLVDSAATAIVNGQIPLRTMPNSLVDTGNPIFQFYSPLVYTITALFVLVCGDLMAGSTLFLLFINTLGFIYSYKLNFYLTRNKLLAIVGAFLFITAPYLATDRALRGATTEYVGFSLLPMVLFYNLRANSSFKPEFIIKAILASSALFLSHIITSVFFFFFYGVFWFFYLGFNLIFHKNRQYNLKKYLKRLAVSVIIIILTSFMVMYNLIPAVFEKDLILREHHLAGYSINYSSHIVPFLTTLSIRDMLYPTENLAVTVRFQFGFLLVAAFVAFSYFNAKNIRSTLAWPTILTCGFIIYVIYLPIIFIGPLKYLDFAQFSFRFIAFFTLVASVMGTVALGNFFKSDFRITQASQKIIAFFLILTSLVLVTPYLHPKGHTPEYPKLLNTQRVKNTPGLIYTNNPYLRIPPNYQTDLTLPPYQEDEVILPLERKNTSKQTFLLNLNDLGERKNLLLDILYFPTLQDILVTLDGQEITPDLTTFWRERLNFGLSYDEKGAFHGLQINNPPKQGLLVVTVTFRGSTIGNIVSLITFIVLLGYSIILYLKPRRYSIFKTQNISKVFR